MSRCLSRASVFTPVRKLSRKRSMRELGAANASFVKVTMMVLSSMDAVPRSSNSRWSSAYIYTRIHDTIISLEKRQRVK
jgi:hypothetical protein